MRATVIFGIKSSVNWLHEQGGKRQESQRKPATMDGAAGLVTATGLSHDSSVWLVDVHVWVVGQPLCFYLCDCDSLFLCHSSSSLFVLFRYLSDLIPLSFANIYLTQVLQHSSAFTQLYLVSDHVISKWAVMDKDINISSPNTAWEDDKPLTLSVSDTDPSEGS